ncbi:MAG: hypothetical protein LBI79_06900 [Nitrososphaerota archaeon]|jgi:hypothetical protein|nr:hypothetical protein [Nitrososphaerota archaeon]
MHPIIIPQQVHQYIHIDLDDAHKNQTISPLYLLQEQIDRRLNIIPDESFRKVIDNLPPYQAHILSTIREQVKEHDRLIEVTKEHVQTIERSR